MQAFINLFSRVVLKWNRRCGIMQFAMFLWNHLNKPENFKSLVFKDLCEHFIQIKPLKLKPRIKKCDLNSLFIYRYILFIMNLYKYFWNLTFRGEIWQKWIAEATDPGLNKTPKENMIHDNLHIYKINIVICDRKNILPW